MEDPGRQTDVRDAIDELVARSEDNPRLRAFHKLHRTHPEILDFLVAAIQLRLQHRSAFSFASLWQYGRWKLDIPGARGAVAAMNDHALSFYSRAIVVLHPEFNGKAEFRTSQADEVLGLRLEAVNAKRAKDYSRRLVWKGGESLERGWRPRRPHIVNPEVVFRYKIH